MGERTTEKKSESQAGIEPTHTFITAELQEPLVSYVVYLCSYTKCPTGLRARQCKCDSDMIMIINDVNGVILATSISSFSQAYY